eukprot:gene18758-biopygen11484
MGVWLWFMGVWLVYGCFPVVVWLWFMGVAARDPAHQDLCLNATHATRSGASEASERDEECLLALPGAALTPL